MEKKIRVGILGLGIMGHRMLAYMPKEPGLEVVAAWDISPEECLRAQSAFPWLNIAADANTLISSSDVDLVYIGVPPKYHVAYAQACVAVGKAIFCEKPLSVSLEEGKKLVEMTHKSNLFNAVNLSLASADAVDILQQELASGAFGTPKSAEISLQFSIWPRGWQQNADWLKYREDGGFTREVTTHFLYLCERFFGPGSLKSKSVHYPENGKLCETQLDAELIFGDVPVSIRSKAETNLEDLISFTINGTSKIFSLQDFYFGYLQTGDVKTPLFSKEDDVAEQARQAQLVNLCDQYHKGTKLLPSFADAYDVQCLIENLLEE
ncbi:Gfo/Idh/MocA family oxidoreductase [Sneathiella marina]|uniref:Gfo/Idh/MocA family oxidoreductase n=1 Tax=Sneathiella marina TaxID=2950108 RepID=A0ABY4WBD4_9PROT|nr:Gfo/Idh/MocA family oxidoreductase [Sneathiella marina]USG61976.1 Gfo/Idh/MocA family oxidoreductase [Sneathiella marina]